MDLISNISPNKPFDKVIRLYYTNLVLNKEFENGNDARSDDENEHRNH